MVSAPVLLSPARPSGGVAVNGFVTPGFERVRTAFVENFTKRHELGGACCAYYRGKKVVDLWGGIRNKETGDPWQEDTMVIVYSATKGFAAMTLAIAHSRGWLDYEKPIATYWPEFAQHGKEAITVRQLLAHQAGLFALDEPVTRELLSDFDRLAIVLARQKPEWRPGSHQAYHGITLGLYQGELMRRIDPRHRTLGQFFQDEIATPLGVDFYIRLPETIPNHRLATMSGATRWQLLTSVPWRLAVDVVNPHSYIARALAGSMLPHDPGPIYARDFESPSGGGVGTARAMACAYSAFAVGGELGLSGETLRLLAAPARPCDHGFYDECMKGEARFSLGFMKPGTIWRFGSWASFGSPGAGGAMGFADPTFGIGYGYVTSRGGTSLAGDPRDVALSAALYASIDG